MNAGMAFGMMLIFLYCCGDIDTVANATYAMYDVCLAATNSLAGATAMIGTVLCKRRPEKRRTDCSRVRHAR